jgi:hypothetical protein
MTITALVAGQRPEVVLGMTREEVLNAFGPSKTHLDTPTNEAVSSVDSYIFKTALNTYEFRLLYSLDKRHSRLNPPERIAEVNFELDAPASDGQAVFMDLPEVVHLCADGCTLWGLRSSNEHNSCTGFCLTLQPSASSTPAEAEEAEWISAHWDPSMKDTHDRLRAEAGNLAIAIGTFGKTIGIKIEGEKIVGGKIHGDLRVASTDTMWIAVKEWSSR